MEITKEETTVQSELLQEINEENGCGDTSDIKSKLLLISYIIN